MKYQENIDRIFAQYKENKELKTAHVFHMYGIGEYGLEDDGAKGYHDSELFKLVAYNLDTKEKVDLGIHDGITMEDIGLTARVRLFLDGSTMILFRGEAVGWYNFSDLEFIRKETVIK